MHPTTQLLEQARKEVTFDINKLSPLLYGGQAEFDNFRKYLLECDKYPEIQNTIDYHNLGRKEQILVKTPAVPVWYKLSNGKVYCSIFLSKQPQELDNYLAPLAYTNSPNVLGVHYSMVLPALEILAGKEQLDKFYNDCVTARVSACYAQTELGHGSDVQNLETRITYDSQTQEFIVNSPTLSSTKCFFFKIYMILPVWPGDLGIFANHALVFGQLIINNKNYGAQAFMVPIRDMETHKLLPGCEAGDIGPKIGYSIKDNGYLRMKNVRIPRVNMLQRFTQVKPDGSVVRVGNPKVSYAAMMIMRKLLVWAFTRGAAQALTIATRYSFVRQQFKNDQGTENSVIDYQIQQDKVFPLIASTYAMIFGGLFLKKLVQQNFLQVTTGNFDLMEVTHALLSGSKSQYTQLTLSNVEWARLSCGGHGYAHYSGLPQLYRDLAPNVISLNFRILQKCTLDGENSIMYLQLTRYLLKSLKISMNSSARINTYFNIFQNLNSTLSFKCSAETIKDIRNPTVLLKLLEVNTVLRTYYAAQKLTSFEDPKEAWNFKAGVDLVQAAESYMEYFNLRIFIETIATCNDDKTFQALNRLSSLYGVSALTANCSQLIENDSITAEHLKLLQQAKMELLNEIRKDVIGFVDAFGFTDGSLKTTIGCYDGQPYERMYEWATTSNSMNQSELVLEAAKRIKTISSKL